MAMKLQWSKNLKCPKQPSPLLHRHSKVLLSAISTYLVWSLQVPSHNCIVSATPPSFAASAWVSNPKSKFLRTSSHPSSRYSKGSTTKTMTIGKPSTPPDFIRRSSSIAYDNKGRLENYQSVDPWRKRCNLPPSSLRNKLTTSSPTRSSSGLSLYPTQQGQRRKKNGRPNFTFGILTDIQYAPIPDGHSYNGTPRYYRHALTAAECAARHFEEERVQCIINLGDTVDGKCKNVEKWGGGTQFSVETIGKENSNSDFEYRNDIAEEEKKCEVISVGHDAVDDVLKALSWYKSGKILHTYGNHELYNLSRKDLAEKLEIPFVMEPSGDLVGYYDHLLHPADDEKHKLPEDNVDQLHRQMQDQLYFSPSESPAASSMKLRFLIIDSYDVSTLERCPQLSPKCKLAHEILSANNHNYPHNENSPEGLDDINKRFVAFNGGVDTPQLEWLQNSLQSAQENDEKVIIFSHQPIHPGSSGPVCLVWNYEQVLEILRKYNDVVLASFSGHAHKGGYVRDEESGIHFRTLEAVLESPNPIHTYAFVDVWEDRLEVRGSGDCVSDVYDLDHLYFSSDYPLERECEA